MKVTGREIVIRSPEVRNARCYYYDWVDTSASGLLVPEDIIHPVVSFGSDMVYYIYLLFKFTVLK